MEIRSVFFILGCSFAISSATSSREKLDQRLNNFNAFWALRVKEIHGAAAAGATARESNVAAAKKAAAAAGEAAEAAAKAAETTKLAVHLATVELQELLTMVVDELKAADEKFEKLEAENSKIASGKEECAKEREILKDELEAAKKINIDQEEELKNVTDAKKQIEGQNKGLNEANHKLKEKNEELKKANQKLELDEAQCLEAEQKLEVEVAARKKYQRELEAAVVQCQEAKEDLERQMLLAGQLLYNVTEQNKELQVDKRNLEVEKTQCKSNLTVAIDKLENANLKIDELEKTIRKMKIEIEISRGGYEMVGGRFVKFYDTKLNWFDASKKCQNSNSRLITVKDEATTQWIVERHVPIWIGANDAMKEGNWTWVGSNETIVNGNWNSGEPNNGMGMWDENCAAANFKTFLWWSPGKWSDRECTKEVRFACEIPDFHPAETLW